MLMRFLHHLALVALFSGGLVQAASAIEVAKIGDKLVKAFRHAGPQEARGYLAGYTVLAKLGQMPGRIKGRIPISTVVVLYFNPNGDLLAWSGKSDIVEKGRWYVGEGRGGNDLCLNFDSSGGEGFCTVLANGRSAQLESTKGNPFGLKANAPTPHKLGFSGQSLAKIAGQLGL
jgi:hypothetical protein